MEYPLYQIDAFTDTVFKGNPAAVVPFAVWPADAVLQAITDENNLSETAFFVLLPDGAYELRWFTTLGEIDLCGHATLASAYVLFYHMGFKGDRITFKTRQAGDLQVSRTGDLLTLDFPSREPLPVKDYPAELMACLNHHQPEQVLLSRDYVLVYRDEAVIRAIDPDFSLMEKINRRICVTAPGKDTDFVSRFFCAGDAMPEDPVTGSAHCSLIPYWAKRLGKTEMLAAQLSKRGGLLQCRLEGERVFIAGKACTYLIGTIFLPDRPGMQAKKEGPDGPPQK
jgi:PhzF family phenazine biosynthesis protein